MARKNFQAQLRAGIRELREPLIAWGAAFVVLSALLLANPPPEEYDFPAEFAEFEDLPQQSEDDSEVVSGIDSESETIAADDSQTAEKSAPSWLEYTIRRNDTMARILDKIGADDEARDFLLAQKLKTYRLLRRGDRLQFRLEDGRLAALRYKTSPEYYLNAGRDSTGEWWAREAPPVLTTVTRAVGGIIESSLFAAADRAGFSDGAIDLLINALETQVDFYRDTRPNDSFRALYTETVDEDGEIIGAGELLAFEYVSLLKPKSPRAIRGARHNGEYYSPQGESLRGAFLRAPLKFRRISSRFSRNRLHPVLKKWRAHRGVDYAAPTGTPVRSTADGVVSSVSRQRGYGNVIMIKHLNIYTTVYAHLSRFAKGMRRGRKVQQGQVIGYVGQTGLATGPHLHYEFRVRGKHKDPLSEAVPKVLPPLEGKALDEFREAAAPLFARLDAAVPR